jgi:hypothetical protein
MSDFLSPITNFGSAAVVALAPQMIQCMTQMHHEVDAPTWTNRDSATFAMRLLLALKETEFDNGFVSRRVRSIARSPWSDFHREVEVRRPVRDVSAFH